MEKKKGNPKAAGVILIILAVFLMALALLLLVSDMDFLMNGAENINQKIADGSMESGEYVEIDVNASFGAYAETKHTINGFIPAGKEQHYVIWLDDDSLISMTVKGKKKYDELEKVVSATESYLMGTGTLSETVRFTGKIGTVSGELKDYYDEALDYLGADMSTNVYYLDIDTTETKGSIIGRTVFIIALGIVLIFAGKASFSQAKKAKMESEGVTPM